MARVKIGNVYPPDEYLLARCAPAGYGLGAAVCATPPDADANKITKVGFFQCTKNTPNENENWYVIHLIHLNGTYEHQISIRVVDGSRAERTKVNGVWGEWERVNPPMTPEIEYRTTERYLDKPVYTMVHNMGQLKNNGDNIAYYHVNSIVCAKNLVESHVILADSYGTEEEAHDFRVLAIPNSTVQYGYKGDKTAYTGKLIIKYTY